MLVGYFPAEVSQVSPVTLTIKYVTAGRPCNIANRQFLLGNHSKEPVLWM